MVHCEVELGVGLKGHVAFWVTFLGYGRQSSYCQICVVDCNLCDSYNACLEQLIVSLASFCTNVEPHISALWRLLYLFDKLRGHTAHERARHVWSGRYVAHTNHFYTHTSMQFSTCCCNFCKHSATAVAFFKIRPPVVFLHTKCRSLA